MKKILSYINIMMCDVGAIVILFLLLAAVTKMDYLEAGVIALVAGSVLSLFMSLEVLQW